MYFNLQKVSLIRLQVVKKRVYLLIKKTLSIWSLSKKLNFFQRGPYIKPETLSIALKDLSSVGEMILP